LELGFQARALRECGNMVLLIGGQEEIEETLRLVFRLMPSQQRRFCSFDTAVEDVRLERGAYWAVGARSLLSGGQLMPVDVVGRQIQSIMNLAAREESLYTEYLRHLLQQDLDLELVAKRAAGVAGLCQLLEGREADPQGFQLEAFPSLLVLQPETVRKHLFMAIPVAREGRHANQLAKLAAEWLLNSRLALKRRERIILQRLAKDTEDQLLLFLASVFGNDARGRNEALRCMSAEEFQRTLAKARGVTPLTSFIHPSHLNSLLQDLHPDQLAGEALTDFLEAVAKVEGGAHLGAFTGWVGDITPGGLRRLARIIKRLTRVDPGFRRRIVEQIQDVNKDRHRSGVWPWAF
jgi:hypothetical protein